MRRAKSMRRAILLLLMLPGVQACVQSPPIFAAATPCSSLVPNEWRAGVHHAPPPAPAEGDLAVLQGWIGFGLGEAGQLEKANGRTADALGIIDRCEARDRDAVKRSQRHKVLGIF